jgi:hypothetical protein
MVGGREQDERILLSAGCNQRGYAGRRRRISADRLKHDVCRAGTDLLELLGDEKSMAMVAEHREIAEEVAAKPCTGLLE